MSPFIGEPFSKLLSKRASVSYYYRGKLFADPGSLTFFFLTTVALHSVLLLELPFISPCAVHTEQLFNRVGRESRNLFFFASRQGKITGNTGNGFRSIVMEQILVTPF